MLTKIYIFFLTIMLIVFAYAAGRLHEIAISNGSDAQHIEGLLENRREFTLFQRYRLYPSAEGKDRWYYKPLKQTKQSVHTNGHKR